MRAIPLTNGGEAIVDDADFEWLSRHSWRREKWGYAVMVKPRSAGYDDKDVFMHRLLATTTAERPQVDHANGDTLDNRRSNLRACTELDNARNHRKRRDSASPYKGVERRETRSRVQFRARIFADGVRRRSGWVESEETAAKLYDGFALAHHGDFARLNFPEPGGSTWLP